VFFVPQFLHNSDKILCLEKNRSTAITSAIVISQTDSTIHRSLGEVKYVWMSNFPTLSQNNLYPIAGANYSVLYCDTGELFDVNVWPSDNEFMISKDGSKAFVSGPGGLPQSLSLTSEAVESARRTLIIPVYRGYTCLT